MNEENKVDNPKKGELQYGQLLGFDQVKAVTPAGTRPSRATSGALLSKIGVGEITPPEEN